MVFDALLHKTISLVYKCVPENKAYDDLSIQNSECHLMFRINTMPRVQEGTHYYL